MSTSARSIRLLLLLTTCICGAVTVRSGYAQEAVAVPTYQLHDPNDFGTSVVGAPQSLPIRVARPFDSGPQAGRNQLNPTPIDVLSAPAVGTYPGAAPYGPVAPPPAYDVPYGPAQAYEYDSFDGNYFDNAFSGDCCDNSWLYPLANLHATWLQGQGDSLGFVELERRFLFTNPLIAPFRIIPGFNTRYVSGPDTTDLPPNLFEISVEVAATFQLQNAWTLDVGVRPGLNTDLEFVNNDSFRLQGHAVMSRPISPTSQAVLGFTYLDREDIPALPVVGLIWQPDSNTKFDLVFPRPRLAVRVAGGPTDDAWVYVKSELGGNSWSIERADGRRDVATYRDIRLILGYETVMPQGIALQFETGWVFSRKVLYESSDPNFTPNDTFMIRVGANY